MSTVWLYALVSVLVVSAISLVGILTLGWKVTFLKKITIFLVSLSA